MSRVRKNRLDDAPRPAVRELQPGEDWYVVWTQETGFELVYLVDDTWDWIVNVEENRPCREGFAAPWLGSELAAIAKAEELTRVISANYGQLDPSEKQGEVLRRLSRWVRTACKGPAGVSAR